MKSQIFNANKVGRLFDDTVVKVGGAIKGLGGTVGGQADQVNVFGIHRQPVCTEIITARRNNNRHPVGRRRVHRFGIVIGGDQIQSVGDFIIRHLNCDAGLGDIDGVYLLLKVADDSGQRTAVER